LKGGGKKNAGALRTRTNHVAEHPTIASKVWEENAQRKAHLIIENKN